MNRNQKGFGVVEIIVLVVILALICVGGWYVWQANIPTSTTQQVTVNTNRALEIPEFGVKINDPDGRNLQMHAQKLCGAECDTEDSYFIKDDNEAYFTRCQYPAGITRAEEDTAQDATRTKKIGDNYFRVFAGTNYQAPCMNLEAGEETYQDELRQYIFANMVEL